MYNSNDNLIEFSTETLQSAVPCNSKIGILGILSDQYIALLSLRSESFNLKYFLILLWNLGLTFLRIL